MAITCPVCGMGFDTQQQLDEHAAQMHGKSNVRCPACGAEFDTQQQLDEHKQSTHAM